MKNKKTKILAIGDIHGEKGLAKKIAEKVKKENIDLVILAGDITFLEDFPKGVLGYLTRTNKEILLIPGNHETNEIMDSLIKHYSGARNIHGSSFKKGDLGIFGVGGADTLLYVIGEKEMFDLLKKGNEQVRDLKKRIMVTHMHHHGSKAEFSGFKGSKSIKKAIKEFKPDILISAHIHEAGGLEEKIGNTRIINVSRKPVVIEI